ncbi:MAG: hypothetical protein ACRDIC_10620 [bacterium]
MLLKGIAGEPAGGFVSAYAYEAARQLAQVTRRRVAVAIIEDLTWWRFKLQLQGKWID